MSRAEGIALARRAIVHFDADSFFVSCEVASKPELRGLPVAVGGTRRGIIASASYEARRVGVYTPMPTSRALRICPGLIVLPGDFDKYEDCSRRMFGIISNYTPLVEAGSIDEGFADFSQIRGCPVADAVMRLRREIRDQLGLPVSMGLAGNKFVASTASKLRKPDNFIEVPIGGEAEFLAPLGVVWLPGIGPKTGARLKSAGLHTIADVASADSETLHNVLGSAAETVRAFALGIDDRPVRVESQEAQSYGEQVTFGRDTGSREFVRSVLRGMADRLMSKIRMDEKTARCVEVRIRYANWEQCQRSESLREPTDLETDTYHVIDRLLEKAWSRQETLRLAGLTFSQLHENRGTIQCDLPLFGDNRAVKRRLALVMDETRKRFGASALVRGHQITSD